MSTTTTHRVVCVSRPQPASPASDILTVCHNFPAPRAQAGVRGRLLTIGDQYVMLLEGVEKAVRGLVNRIQQEVPEAAMAVHVRDSADSPAFTTWSITDLYVDEIAVCDPEAAERLTDRIIDLLSGDSIRIVDATEEAVDEVAVEDLDETAQQDATDEATEDAESLAEPIDAFREAAAILDRFAWTPGATPTPAAVDAA